MQTAHRRRVSQMTVLSRESKERNQDSEGRQTGERIGKVCCDWKVQTRNTSGNLDVAGECHVCFAGTWGHSPDDVMKRRSCEIAMRLALHSWNAMRLLLNTSVHAST